MQCALDAVRSPFVIRLGTVILSAYIIELYFLVLFVNTQAIAIVDSLSLIEHYYLFMITIQC